MLITANTGTSADTRVRAHDEYDAIINNITNDEQTTMEKCTSFFEAQFMCIHRGYIT